MRKNLRRPSAATPKCYMELDEQVPVPPLVEDKRDRQYKQAARESIFQNKNWLVKQKIKLMVFFAYYISLQDWNSQRKSIHLYKHLSNFMKKTRTPEQCKNVHSLLKRKFNTLHDVVEAMRLQLELEEDYEKLLNKYEKDIKVYQLENKLKDERFDDMRYESLLSKKVTEDDKKFKTVEELAVRDHSRLYKTQKPYEHINELNLIMIKKDFNQSSFQIQKQKLVKECNFYFKEWLKLSLIYQQRQSAAKHE